MNKPSLKTLCTTMLLATAIAACKKNDADEKPAVDPTKNILTCRVDEVYHEYTGTLPPGISGTTEWADLDTLIIRNVPRLCINASSKRKYDDHIRMYLEPSQAVIGSLATPKLNTRYPLINYQEKSHYYTGAGDAYLTYKADTTKSYVIFSHYEKGSITGTFEFYGLNPYNKSVSITEGSFNIKN